MKNDINPSFAQHRVGRLAPDMRIVHPRPSLSVQNRIGKAAHRFKPAAKLVGEAKDDLVGPACNILRCFIKATHRSGETGNGSATAESVAFNQGDFQSLPSSRYRGRHAGCAASYHDDIGIDASGIAIVQCSDL